MQNQPEGSESRRAKALDLGAVPWAGERPGRQKGGFGDAGHSVPLSPENGKGLVKGLSPSFGSDIPL